MAKIDLIFKSYAESRILIQDADVLLSRPVSAFGRIISYFTGPYSHAMLAVWHHKRLLYIDATVSRGISASNLSELVEKNPGKIDVYRRRSMDDSPVRIALDNMKITDVALDYLNINYGCWSLIKAGLINLRWTRRFWRKVLRAGCDLESGHLPHCAMFDSIAYQRGANIDLCPGLAPWATTPSDLAASSSLEYVFTLF